MTQADHEYYFGFENIHILGSSSTPKILLNKDEGIIELRGNSFTEDSKTFYWSLSRWLMEYSYEPAEKTKVLLAFNYMNSSSNMVVAQMFARLNELLNGGSLLDVEWYYEKGDTDMQDLGIYYQQLVRCPFRLIEVKDIMDQS